MTDEETTDEETTDEETTDEETTDEESTSAATPTPEPAHYGVLRSIAELADNELRLVHEFVQKELQHRSTTQT